jgi:UDP-glucose 4-epimerase
MTDAPSESIQKSEKNPKLALVTGGAGFIGSHLCERLAAEGYRVISLDNYFTGTRENHVPGVEYREGHTKDIEQLVPETPDIVYHLGEYSRVEKSFEDIETVWDLNKTGTFAVLEFVRRRGSKIVYAGSSTKFSDSGAGKDESPYAWSKATNTELVKNYAAWFGIPYAITYFYNVYGPRERAGAFGTVIEIFRQNYLHGRPISVVSPGTQKRNFTHVSDIVDGLILVGKKGNRDEFGLGNEKAYSVREVAELFSDDIVLLPERAGNRMGSDIDTKNAYALGWRAKKDLVEYISAFKATAKPVKVVDNRILVFTTTFHPITGPAEEALLTLMENIPELHFDVITSAHTKEALRTEPPLNNVTIYRVGKGNSFDKYLLPFAGASKAKELAIKNEYLFSWSLMASYGTFPALAVRKYAKLPLLVTLANQDLSFRVRFFLRFVLRNADQVYATTLEQGKKIPSLARRMTTQRSLGAGDSFANQIRFAYSTILRNQVNKT